MAMSQQREGINMIFNESKLFKARVNDWNANIQIQNGRKCLISYSSLFPFLPRRVGGCLRRLRRLSTWINNIKQTEIMRGVWIYQWFFLIPYELFESKQKLTNLKHLILEIRCSNGVIKVPIVRVLILIPENCTMVLITMENREWKRTYRRRPAWGKLEAPQG